MTESVDSLSRSDATWFLFGQFLTLWPDFLPTLGLFGENCLLKLVLVSGQWKLWADNLFCLKSPLNSSRHRLSPPLVDRWLRPRLGDNVLVEPGNRKRTYVRTTKQHKRWQHFNPTQKVEKQRSSPPPRSWPWHGKWPPLPQRNQRGAFHQIWTKMSPFEWPIIINIAKITKLP